MVDFLKIFLASDLLGIDSFNRLRSIWTLEVYRHYNDTNEILFAKQEYFSIQMTISVVRNLQFLNDIYKFGLVCAYI